MRFEKETNLYQDAAIANKFSSQDTQFNVVNGKISYLISDSDIEEYEDKSKTVTSRLNSSEDSIGRHSRQISSLQTDIVGINGNIDTFKSEVNTFEQTTNSTISSITSTVATKTQVWTVQPTVPYLANDFWIRDNVLYVCTVSRAIGSFNASDWKPATKGRIFTSEPTTPYYSGDAWMQGDTGEILFCNATRLTGDCSIDDWKKASKYTDDSAFNNWTQNTYNSFIEQLPSQINLQVTGSREIDANAKYTSKASIIATINDQTFESGVRINADRITLDGDATINAINGATGTVVVNANKVELSGYTTLSSLENGTTVINGSCITTGSLDANRITSGTITSEQIAGSTITGDNIASGTITADNIAAGTITSTEIATGTITADNITTNTITADQLALETITADRIAGSAIIGEKIAAEAITTEKIASEAITTEKIKAEAITADKIKAGEITSSQIKASTITGNNIDANTITAKNIALGTITADRIATETITADRIKGSTITGDKIASETITASNIKSSTITSSQIAAGTIKSSNIEANTIKASNIALNTITADRIATETITADRIKGSTITGDKIASETITASNIKSSTITSSQIAAGTIKSSNIEANTITADRIALKTITADRIATETITADRIKGSTITGDKIASETITASNIKSGSITANEIKGSTITGTEIASKTITADNIAVGTITADRIAAGTITADKLSAKYLTSTDVGSNGSTIISGSRITTGAITGKNGNVVFDVTNGSLKMNSGSINIGGKFIVNTDGSVTMKSATIDGYIKPEDVSASGKTSISGKRIVTGSIDADKLSVKFLSTTDVGENGNTTISGSRITTGKIQGKNGNVVFDLTNGKLTMNKGSINIGGKFIVKEDGSATLTSVTVTGYDTSTSVTNKINSALGGYAKRTDLDSYVTFEDTNNFATKTGLKTSGYTTIDGGNLANYSISTYKIAAGAITAAKIAAKTITASEIDSGAITAEKIASGAITASMITTGTLKDSNSNVVLNLTSGTFTMKSGSINISNGAFIVTTKGALTATNANITTKTSNNNVQIHDNEISLRNGTTEYAYIDYADNFVNFLTTSTGSTINIGLGNNFSKGVQCDSSGIYVKGNIRASGNKPRIVKTNDYDTRTLYCYEMPYPMFGDIGEAIINEDGYCYINIDPIFLETVSVDSYQVFLQKCGLGDCYVYKTYPTYFIIYGTPKLKVYWEIKCKQFDWENNRLTTDTIYRVNIGNIIPYDYSSKGHLENIKSYDYGEEAYNHIAAINEERNIL